MRKYLFIVCCLLGLSCCEEDERTYNNIPEGIYTGTFQRELPGSPNDTAKITMTFGSGTWSGSGNRIKYPALCSGTYSIAGDSINFVNDCIWTAEFDWSLILAGKYRLQSEGNRVVFRRDYRAASSVIFTDKYILVRQ